MMKTYYIITKGEKYERVIGNIKLQQLLYDAPAADVQEVKHAIWFRDPAKRNSWCCSRCGKFAMSDCHMWILTNYCPHCGAKMED